MLKRFVGLMVMLVPVLAFAGGENAGAAPPPAPPAPPAEIRKTVDMFVGKTVFNATLTVGSEKPISTKFTFDCKKIAGGAGVSCAATSGKTPIGQMLGQFMIAYDPGMKVVRFMAVTNLGEVHDHICRWADDSTMTCDPLKATDPMTGGMITEDVKTTWAGGSVTFESITTNADGSKLTFTGTAKRK